MTIGDSDSDIKRDGDGDGDDDYNNGDVNGNLTGVGIQSGFKRPNWLQDKLGTMKQFFFSKKTSIVNMYMYHTDNIYR